jgi:hypothetical protein
MQVVRGDVLDAQSLLAAMEGIEIAYYLVHSIGSLDDFVELDRRGAKNFADAARQSGVRGIIYTKKLPVWPYNWNDKIRYFAIPSAPFVRRSFEIHLSINCSHSISLPSVCRQSLSDRLVCKLIDDFGGCQGLLRL